METLGSRHPANQQSTLLVTKRLLPPGRPAFGMRFAETASQESPELQLRRQLELHIAQTPVTYSLQPPAGGFGNPSLPPAHQKQAETLNKIKEKVEMAEELD